MHKWHTVGIKEGYLYKPEIFSSFTVCKVPAMGLEQITRWNPDGHLFQSHHFRVGDRALETWSDVLKSMLLIGAELRLKPRQASWRSPVLPLPRVSPKMHLVSVPPWNSLVDLDSQELFCPLPWFSDLPFLFYFGSLQWWWHYFSVPFFLRHPRSVCVCVAFIKFTRDRWII